MMLRAMVIRLVCLGVGHPLVDLDHILISSSTTSSSSSETTAVILF
jgi:hypothetical protein